jgi:hypothetical protein
MEDFFTNLAEAEKRLKNASRKHTKIGKQITSKTLKGSILLCVAQ